MKRSEEIILMIAAFAAMVVICLLASWFITPIVRPTPPVRIPHKETLTEKAGHFSGKMIGRGIRGAVRGAVDGVSGR